MNERLPNEDLNTCARDPIDWAIIGVILAGCSLVLSLEQKIEARRHAESGEAAKKAQGGNRLRLRTIRKHIDEIRGYVADIKEFGKIVVNPGKEGITRSSIIFSSDEDEERFNQNFDRTTALIARINRCLSEIDPQGIPIDDDDVRVFVSDPIRRAQERAAVILEVGMDPLDRIAKVDDLLKDYSDLVGNLERILGER